MYLYDPRSDIWSKFPDLPVRLHRLAADVAGGDLFIIGGYNSNYESVATVYKLPAAYLADAYQKETISSLTWEATTPSGTSVELFYSYDLGKTYTSLGTTPGTYYLPANSAYSFRYKAVLSTNDTSVTPSLDSVSVAYAQEADGLYHTTGVYTSRDLAFSQSADLYSLEVEKEEPAGTSVSLEYSLDEGVTWTNLGNATSYTFPALTKTNHFQYRLTLSSTDANQTPVVKKVTLSHSAAESITNKPTEVKLSWAGDRQVISRTGTNYIDKKDPELSGTNQLAKGGKVRIYKKTKHGRKRVATVSINQQGNWSYQLEQGSGREDYYLQTEDALGNRSRMSKRIKIYVDKEDPVFEDETAQCQIKAKCTFSAQDQGSGIAFYKVKLLDKEGKELRDWRKQQQDFYQVPEKLQKQAATLLIWAYDKAGNVEEKKLTIK